MKRPPIPSNEKSRIRALKEYDILDTLPENEYDDVTKLASYVCGTPIALISIIDNDRQWFKSHQGLDTRETPREIAFCAHAINTPNEILEVPDAHRDDRFKDNPLAIGDPNIRFYAGAPLTDDEGHTLGTLCVIDHKKNHLDEVQKELLWSLSRQVVTLLQLRKENTKRTKADKAFNTMVESLGDGVFELDGEGRCTYANSKMLEMLDRDLSDVKDTLIWDMIDSRDVPAMQKFYVDQFQKQSPKCRYEYRLTPKDGEPIWVAQNTTMEYDGDRMIRLRSISRDISETKKLEKELALKESLYKLVSENSSDLIAIHDTDGLYKFVSPSASDILGFNSDELVGKSPYDFIHKDDVIKLQEGPHQETLSGSGVQNVEYRIKKKNGDYLWMQSYSTPIIGEEGNVVSFQTSSRDITEKKKEELRISKHLEGLTLLNELASVPSSDIVLDLALQRVTHYLELEIGIVSHIREGKFIIKNSYTLNHELNHLKQYQIKNSLSEASFNSEGVLMNNKLTEGVTHPCFSEIGPKSYIGINISKHGEKYGTIEFFSLNKERQEFNWYDKEFIQLFANWVGSILETHEEKELLRRARKHAEAASEAKASFLSMMSHEIRTPLNGIIGTTHLLLGKSPSETQLPHLKVLEQSSSNLMAIVNDILDFGKIEEGKIQIDQAVFNLKELVSSIYNNHKIQGDEKGINVILKYDQSLSHHYVGDSVRISQILHNLLSNAVKFTSIGMVEFSLIKSSSHDDFDEVQFVVKDSGIGIPKEKQEEIFDIFIQADKTTTREFGGSGLGLAITKRLLELMNSKIHLESAPNEGSTFSFKMIMKRSSQEANQQTTDSVQGEYKKLNASILLVEDNKFNRAIAKDFLESWGCSVLEAEHGKEALDHLENQKVDLVLLDLQMPVMDGYETINAIRTKKAENIKNLPVIALTAAAMGDVEGKVYQSGMDGFITKPFLPVDFYQKIATHLSHLTKSSSETSAESQILNKLQETLGPEEDQIELYYDVFVETLVEENEVLKACIRGENLPALKSYAHKNKSSLLLGGLSELGNEAEELEDMISRNTADSHVLEKAMNHQRKIDKILSELNKK